MSWYNFTGAVQGGGLPDDDERRRRRLHHTDAGMSFAMGNVAKPAPQQPIGATVLEQPGGAAGAVQGLQQTVPQQTEQPVHAPRMGAAVDLGYGSVQPSSSPTGGGKRAADTIESQEDIDAQRMQAKMYFDDPVKPVKPVPGGGGPPPQGPGIKDIVPSLPDGVPPPRGDDIVWRRDRRSPSPQPDPPWIWRATQVQDPQVEDPHLQADLPNHLVEAADPQTSPQTSPPAAAVEVEEVPPVETTTLLNVCGSALRSSNKWRMSQRA